MNNENEEVFEELSEREQLETIIADATGKLEKLEEREHLEATIEEASKRLEELTERENLNVNGGCLERGFDKNNIRKFRLSWPVGKWIDLNQFIYVQGRSYPWDIWFFCAEHIKPGRRRMKRYSKNWVYLGL